MSSFNFAEIFPMDDQNGYIDEERWRRMTEITNRYTPPVNPEAYFKENDLIEHGGGYNPFLNWKERWLIDGQTVRIYNKEPGVFPGPESTQPPIEPEPQVATPEPQIATPEPQMTASEPQVAALEPQVAALEPQMSDPEPQEDEPPELIFIAGLNREELGRLLHQAQVGALFTG